MRGVLEKDFRSYRKTVLLTLALVVLYAAFCCLMPGFDLVHSVLFVGWMGAVAAVNEVADDERNGYAFLMTLPVDARSYVLAKLVYVTTVQVHFWILARVTLLVGTLLDGKKPDIPALLSKGLALHFGMVALLMLILTFVIKFGVKSILYLAGGLVMLVCVFCVLVVTKPDANWVDALLRIGRFPHIGIYPTAAAIIATAGLTRLAVHFMRNKEF